jgi:hypothetical protein
VSIPPSPRLWRTGRGFKFVFNPAAKH